MKQRLPPHLRTQGTVKGWASRPSGRRGRGCDVPHSTHNRRAKCKGVRVLQDLGYCLLLSPLLGTVFLRFHEAAGVLPDNRGGEIRGL